MIPLFAILLLLLILISLSLTTSPTSRTPALYTFVTPPKFDYCKSLFLNLESTQRKHLLLIQNSCMVRMPWHNHITPILKSFHRLKIPEHFHFKVLLLQLPALLPTHLPSLLSQVALPDHPRVTTFSTCITSHLKFSN